MSMCNNLCLFLVNTGFMYSLRGHVLSITCILLFHRAGGVRSCDEVSGVYARVCK